MSTCVRTSRSPEQHPRLPRARVRVRVRARGAEPKAGRGRGRGRGRGLRSRRDAGERPVRLGERLLVVGLVSEAAVAEALGAQMAYGGRLGTNLVELFHLDLD